LVDLPLHELENDGIDIGIEFDQYGDIIKSNADGGDVVNNPDNNPDNNTDNNNNSEKITPKAQTLPKIPINKKIALTNPYFLSLFPQNEEAYYEPDYNKLYYDQDSAPDNPNAIISQQFQSLLDNFPQQFIRVENNNNSQNNNSNNNSSQLYRLDGNIITGEAIQNITDSINEMGLRVINTVDQ